MNEHQNPFAAPRAVSKHAKAWTYLWITAGTLAGIGAAVAAWLAFQQQTEQLQVLRKELAETHGLATRTQREAVDLREKLLAGQAQASELSNQLASSQSRVADLVKEKETVTQKHHGLEEEMRAELESKDVTISQLQGKLTVNILDRILFDSGEAVLKSGGETVLNKIAGILAQHPTLKIHVIGHTDNVPIRPSGRSRFPSNWELSTARALAAVRFLTERAEVDPCRLGAVGYGEFRPVADNSTSEGRAQNRRIAITILADELAGADTVPSVTTNLTNSPSPAPLTAPEPEKTEPDKE